MSNILTPVTLWKDFDDSLPLDESVIREFKLDNILYREVYFSGRETGGGRPRIYAMHAAVDAQKDRATILILPDYDQSIDMELMTVYAAKGYNVLMVDYSGENSARERFTVYPKEIEYANYLKAGRRLDFVDDTAKETCLYEWTAVARYAVSYLKSIESTGKIGVLGIRHGGEIMWQLLSCADGIACGISLFGLGWNAYNGKFKFEEKPDKPLDEERYRYIAGIDAHAYAPYAKCPVMLLSSTNDSHFDADRTFDTLARVNPEVESLGNFSVRYDGFLGSNSLKDIDLFFDKYLNGADIFIPKPIEISIDTEGGEYIISAEFEAGKPTDAIEVYYSDGQINPALRDWRMAEFFGKKGNVSKFKPELCELSDYVFAFAKADYSGGFTASSKICTKRIEKAAKNLYPKSRVLYDSKNGQDGFTVITPTNLVGGILFEAGEKPVAIVQGPFGIDGVYSAYGLKTYRVGAERFRAEDGFILKFDAYSKTFNKLTVSVSAGYLTENQQSYSAEVVLHGGEVWQSVKLESKDFKTESGRPLKSFFEADVLTFEGVSEYCINNIIWL